MIGIGKPNIHPSNAYLIFPARLIVDLVVIDFPVFRSKFVVDLMHSALGEQNRVDRKRHARLKCDIRRV